MSSKSGYGSIGVSSPFKSDLTATCSTIDSESPLSEDRERIPSVPRAQSKSIRWFLGFVVVLLAADILIHTRSAGPQTNQEEEPLVIDDDDEGPRRPENIPRYFTQKVDHFDATNSNTWQHRYYAQTKYFQGPGHPIILVVGGEGGNDDGFFYPFVEEHLASKFGAFVLHPEHRFYGISQPVDPAIATNDDLKKLFSVPQAIEDFLAIIQFYQRDFGCSTDKSSPEYCPVMTVGGSYPGFVSAIMRLGYPDIVDIGYASSAPLLLYSMEADQFGYMEIVTRTAEDASPGCSEAVRTTLAEVDHALRNSDHDGYLSIGHEKLNICPGSMPPYVKSGAILSEELLMLVATTMADANMFNYPPSSETTLARICRNVFQDESLSSFEKLARFWVDYLEENIDPNLPCFDMSSQLPTGRRPTISGSDWSGIGVGHDGEMFDYQCCATLTPAVGFSNESMFPYRKWTLEWLTNHCLDRFDVTPDPYKLVREYHFDDLLGQGATKILFTNGLNDLWSAGSHLVALSEDLPVVNMKLGAHHSELRYTNEYNKDTEDVRRGHDEITKILADWLNEIKGEEAF